MTEAPAAARARAVSSPSPPEAPVTRTFLPDKSRPSKISFVVVSLFHLLKASSFNNQQSRPERLFLMIGLNQTLHGSMF